MLATCLENGSSRAVSFFALHYFLMLNNINISTLRYSRCYLHTIIFRSFNKGRNHGEVDLFLETRGFTGPVKEGILKAFPSKPTVRELEALGRTGLQELAKSIRQNFDQLLREKNITVHFTVPHRNSKISVNGREGDSFLDLVLENTDLKSYLECSCGGIAG